MWAPGIDDPAAWTDLISKMKDGIMATFDANVQLREDEVRRSENQRQIPGWNFCTFYMLKVTNCGPVLTNAIKSDVFSAGKPSQLV